MSKTFYFSGHETVGAYVQKRLKEIGWTRVETLGEADAALSYCTSTYTLEEVYFGSDGFVKNAKSSALLIDLSPSTPSFARELSAVATVSDLHPVEAPLAVKDPAVRQAFSHDNVCCFAAGEQDCLDEAQPLLEALAQTVQHTGAFGSAQLAKAAHTAQVTAQVMAAVEADALRRAMKSQGQVTGMVESAFPLVGDTARHIVAAAAADEYDGDYTVEMLMADVAAAMTAADDVELILPQLEAVFHLLEIVAVIGGSDKSPAVLSLVYQDEAASEKAGLDWTRAEGLFASDHDHEHDHEHHHHHHGHDDYDYDDYDDYDDFGGSYGGFQDFAGSYRGYSEN